MKYLGQRPLSSHHGNLPRQKYLFESKIAGVGSLGPNRDLFQERQELSGMAGTTYEPYKRYNHHRLVVNGFKMGLQRLKINNCQDPALHN